MVTKIISSDHSLLSVCSLPFNFRSLKSRVSSSLACYEVYKWLMLANYLFTYSISLVINDFVLNFDYFYHAFANIPVQYSIVNNED